MTDGPERERGQLIVLTVIVIAIGLTTLGIAYLQLGYASETAISDTIESPEADLVTALELASAEIRPERPQAWSNRDHVATAVGHRFDQQATRIERIAADRKTVYRITRNTTATIPTAECQTGAGATQFGTCETIDGVVVQHRANEVVVIGLVVDIEIMTAQRNHHSTRVITLMPEDTTQIN